MAPQSFRAPVGARDVLPPESARWEALVVRFAAAMRAAGYGLVVTPIFEEVGVFQRVGEGTDVVRKEMYEFQDRSGRELALRPEGTASVVRAYIQHRPPLPFKGWYVAPHFRYERPQAGRYRQHHQLGAEALGSDDPDLDVELISVAWAVLAGLGLSHVTLLLNSLGDDTCRPAYQTALREFLDEHVDEPCDEHRGRAGENPLRLLDCKREACRKATAGAPRTVDYLCEPCTGHFDRVKDGLAAFGVPYMVEPRLVRGLDYYTRTAFELQAGALEAAQNGLGGGGRYDKLVEALGGPPTPGIGFGLGIERTLLACDAEGVFPEDEARIAVWVVDTTGGCHARDITHALREAGIAADRAFDDRGMKAQFRAADRSGARVAVVVGEREAADGVAQVRDLRTGEQRAVPRPGLVRYLKSAL